MPGRHRLRQFRGRPPLALDLAHGDRVRGDRPARHQLAQFVDRPGHRLVGEDGVLGDLRRLHPFGAPGLREPAAVPGGDPAEGHAAADRPVQRTVQGLGDVADGAQSEQDARVLRAQPLDAAHRLGGDRPRGVVQDQAGEVRAPGPDDGVELGEDEPGDQPAGLLVAALGQVDPHPQGVVGQRAQGERAAGSATAEEVGEQRTVQQREAVGQRPARVAVPTRLPQACLEFAAHELVAARGERLPQRVQRALLPLQQFAQLGQGGEAAVHRVEGAEELGQRGAGALRAHRLQVAHQCLGEEFGRLVGVLGLGVGVEVVHRGGVTDADDHVEGVVGAERVPRRGDGDDGAGPGERLQRERLGDRFDQGAGLAGAGGADGEQRGAEHVRAEGGPGLPVGVRGALGLRPAADPHLAGEQVVPGGAAGQVPGAGRVRGGRAAPAQHAVAETAQCGLAPGALEGALDADAVDVVHPAAGDLDGEQIGEVVLARLPQQGPVGAGALGRPGAGGGGLGSLPVEQLARVGTPVPEAGEGPHDEQGDDRVERVGEQGGCHQVVAVGEQHEQGEQRVDDRHGGPADDGEGLREDEAEGEEGETGGGQDAYRRGQAVHVVAQNGAPAPEHGHRAHEQAEEDAVGDHQVVLAGEDPGLQPSTGRGEDTVSGHHQSFGENIRRMVPLYGR